MDYEKVSELIRRYNLGEYKDYNEKVYLESELRDIVLTGLELVDKGILEKIIESSSKETIERLERDEKLIEGYKKKIYKLSKKYRELKDDKNIPKEEDDEYINNLEETIIRIKSLISGKQGTIIDEIRTVLEEYS